GAVEWDEGFLWPSRGVVDGPRHYFFPGSAFTSDQDRHICFCDPPRSIHGLEHLARDGPAAKIRRLILSGPDTEAVILCRLRGVKPSQLINKDLDRMNYPKRQDLRLRLD